MRNPTQTAPTSTRSGAKSVDTVNTFFLSHPNGSDGFADIDWPHGRESRLALGPDQC